MEKKLAVIASSPLFEMLSRSELELLAKLAEQRRYAAGECVFEEGELGDSLYVIMHGEVEVVRREQGGPHPLTVFAPPQFFGEMSVIDKEYRSATIRARTEAELLRLSTQHLATFREQYRDGFTFVVINIARSLSERLREANARLASGRA